MYQCVLIAKFGHLRKQQIVCAVCFGNFVVTRLSKFGSMVSACCNYFALTRLCAGKMCVNTKLRKSNGCLCDISYNTSPLFTSSLIIQIELL